MINWIKNNIIKYGRLQSGERAFDFYQREGEEEREKFKDIFRHGLDTPGPGEKPRIIPPNGGDSHLRGGGDDPNAKHLKPSYIISEKA